MASVVISGDTSGAITISAPAVAGTNTLTLPVATDTLVGKTTTDTLTNKTLTSPTLTTPALGTPASGVMTNVTGINYDGFKNRIINGAMVIDQRNAGASVTPTNYQYTLDRWSFEVRQTSKLTTQQSTTVPSSGFKNSLLITSSSAYSVISTDRFNLQQYIEGYNIADLNWGSASASTVTISFWIRSSLTGTFAGSVQNGSQNRSYIFNYTINSANTFEYKTVTIAGDQSGTWSTDNSAGLILNFALGTGSTYQGTASTWTGSNVQSTSGAVSLVGTNGATFYITGVQLEKGSTATSFDYRPYGTELSLCQRYYFRTNQNVGVATALCNASLYNAVTAYGVYAYKTTMRSAPTGNSSASTAITTYANGAGYVSSAISFNSIYLDQAEITTTVSGATAGNGAFMRLTSTSTWVDFSAEL